MSTITCPTCNAEVPADAVYCDNCGAKLPAAPAATPTAALRCPNCGAGVTAGEDFCGNCGSPLPASISAVSSGPPVSPEPPNWAPPPNVSDDPVAGLLCPNCGSNVQPDDAFCDNCGHALLPAVQPGFPAEPQRPATYSADPAAAPVDLAPRPESSGVASPHLIVQPGDTVMQLAGDKREFTIGREDAVSGSYPDIDLVPYGGEEGGVSRRHARITVHDGEYFIEDLNSVNYTFVNRQKIATQTPYPIKDGDELRLGRVILRFKTG